LKIIPQRVSRSKSEGRWLKASLFAYLNVCKHLPVTLDLNDDNFFTFDKAFLQCHMHGAMYEIETGYCVGGPCLGARLDALSLAETEDELLITVPDSAANPK